MEDGEVYDRMKNWVNPGLAGQNDDTSSPFRVTEWFRAGFANCFTAMNAVSDFANAASVAARTGFSGVVVERFRRTDGQVAGMRDNSSAIAQTSKVFSSTECPNAPIAKFADLSAHTAHDCGVCRKCV